MVQCVHAAEDPVTTSRNRFLILATATLLAACARDPFTVSTQSIGSLTAVFSKDADWGTGYQGKYTITNGGSAAVSGWRVEFDLPSGSRLTSFWEAAVKTTGNHNVAVNRSYNGTIAAGASTTFGL